MNTKLLKQSITIKVVAGRTLVSYADEHEESVSFLLTQDETRRLATILLRAADGAIGPTRMNF